MKGVDTKLSYKEYEPLSLLQNIGLTFLKQIGKKPIELLFDIDKNLPAKLVGDELHLGQILSHIVNHAIQNTDEGYVRLTLGFKELQEGHCRLSVSVQDSGAGIRREELKSASLAAAKTLIERMGGGFRVESQHDGGTKVSFYVMQDLVQPYQPAVELEEFRGRRVYACLKSPRLLEILQGLVSTYGLEYVADPTLDDPIDYIFVDFSTFRSKTGRRIQQLKELGARVIILQNPMEGSHRRRDELFCSLPLYTASFAGALRGDDAAAREPSMLRSDAAPASASAAVRGGINSAASEVPACLRLAQEREAVVPDPLPEIPGVDVEKGIAYCQSYHFLCEMFGDFVERIEEKSEHIQNLLDCEDYKNYTAEVHGLKGICRMIGASSLVNELSELEKLGRAEDLGALKLRTSEVLQHYRETGDAVNKHIS